MPRKNIFKIISILAAFTFLFTNILAHADYSASMKVNKSLRAPMQSDQDMMAALSKGSALSNKSKKLYSFSTEGVPEFIGLEQKQYPFVYTETEVAQEDSQLRACMQDPKANKIFREYDLREDKDVFNEERTRAIIAAQVVLAYRMGKNNNRKVVIASDQEDYNSAGVRIAIEEYQKAGFEVIHINRPVTAPVTYMAVLHYGADNTVYFSASHNPYGDKGLKIGIKQGTTFGPYGTNLLKETALKGLRAKNAANADQKKITELGFKELAVVLEYYHDVHKKLGISFTPGKFYFVINPIHGTSGYDKDGNSTLISLLKMMGASDADYEMNMLPDMKSSQFIPDQRQPNPELGWVQKDIMPALITAKKSHVKKEVVGIASDRDADRMTQYGIGANTTADKLGVLAIRQLAANYRSMHPDDDRKIVVYADMKCSLLVFDDSELKKLNVEVRPSKTGHSYLKWHLNEAGKNKNEIVLAAFEQSGHCFIKEDPANPESFVIEDPLALFFARLQYLEKHNQSLAQALETVAPYEVGPSTKFYLDAAKFNPKESGASDLKDRKYNIMEEAAKRVSELKGKLIGVNNRQYRVIGVEDIDKINMRIFLAGPDGKQLIGSIVFRPSSNEEVATINIDCHMERMKELGITPAQFFADTQNFIVFDLCAKYFDEFTTLYPTAANKKLGILNSADMQGTEQVEYSQANGWSIAKTSSPVASDNKIEVIIKNDITGKEVSILVEEADIAKDRGNAKSKTTTSHFITSSAL